MKKILVAVSLAAMLTLGSTAALAVPVGSGTAPSYNSTEMQDNLVTTDAANDNGLFNANGTGIGVGTNDGSTLDTVIKAAYNGAVKSKTHTAYQKNTNACAACHQTHTGAAKNLLFKDGVYNTCTACHDGTLGFYNVFTPSAAGTFGGTSGGNMSVHLANDTVLVKAAPGGNAAGTDEKSWGASFDCASCHAPHGSYSPRLLNWNPNDMGDVAPAEGGIAAVTDTIYGVADLTNPAVIAAGAPYIAVRGTANDLGITAGSSSVAIKVYELNPDKTAYVAATNPWIYEYTYDHTHTFKAYVTNFFKNGVTDYTAVQAAADAGYKKGNATYDAAQANIINADDTGLKWYYGAGYVISTSAAGDTLLNSAQTADVARAYVVKLDMQNTTIYGGHQLQTSNDKSLWAGGTFAGYGVTVSKYCAACHTDYMASSGSATGTFSTAYRHSTTSDSYTCLRCHFAHGTDVNVMRDATTKTAADLVADGTYATLADAQAYMLDQNPSSALKKFTNMSVCWGCHTRSHSGAFINTQYYQDAFNAGTAMSGLANGF